jgi:hypothetical protein
VVGAKDLKNGSRSHIRGVDVSHCSAISLAKRLLLLYKTTKRYKNALHQGRGTKKSPKLRPREVDPVDQSDCTFDFNS